MSFLKKDNSDENREFSSRVRIVAREAFVVLVGMVLLTFLFLRFTEIKNVLGSIAKSLQGIFFGVIIAYLLDPLVKIYRRMLEKLFRKSPNRVRLAKGFGIALGIVTGLLILVLLVSLIIPSLIGSVSHLVAEIPDYVTTTQNYIARMLKNYPQVEDYLSSLTSGALGNFQTFVSGKIGDWTNNIMSTVGNGLMDFLKSMMNLLIGFIIAVYLLRDKNLAISQGRKIIYAALSPKRADYTMDILKQAHALFSGFIIGKLIDSLIIGLITAIFMIVARMPYAALISVIIGVTNIIPFFGPFIGAIPSALLVLMTSPLKCLIFVIFILVLQQIDGNIIGPRILGNRTNLNEFWVTFAILFFGGIFGFFGMVAGVPLFGLIYYMAAQVIDMSLKKKGLPVETSLYRHAGNSEKMMAAERRLEEEKAKQEAEPETEKEEPEKTETGEQETEKPEEEQPLKETAEKTEDERKEISAEETSTEDPSTEALSTEDSSTEVPSVDHTDGTSEKLPDTTEKE